MKSEKSERIVDLAASLAAKADDLDQVLIIYRRKQTGDDKDILGSMANDLEARDALWLSEGFTQWLMLASHGLLPEKH